MKMNGGNQMSLFRGCATAIITPFLAEGIDYQGLGRLIEEQIESGIDAIILAGTTGEAATLSEKEYKDLIEFGVKCVAGRVPLIIGAGSNATQKAVENCQYAEAMGADGVLVVNPYYNKGTQKSIVEHFRAINQGISLPILVYNVPSRTGMNIQAETVLELSKLEHVVGIKEASGDINQIAEICRICPEDFDVYSGNDNMVVPVMSLGGIGVISVVSNIIPKEVVEMTHLYLAGKTVEAKNKQLSMNGLVNAMFIESNPAPVKFALNQLGKPAGILRLPLMEISEVSQVEVLASMRDFGLLECE